jgi:hypothetical protein
LKPWKFELELENSENLALKNSQPEPWNLTLLLLQVFSRIERLEYGFFTFENRFELTEMATDRIVKRTKNETKNALGLKTLNQQYLNPETSKSSLQGVSKLKFKSKIKILILGDFETYNPLNFGF